MTQTGKASTTNNASALSLEEAVAQSPRKWVYLFTEGNARMRDLLGGKGSGVAETLARLLLDGPERLEDVVPEAVRELLAGRAPARPRRAPPAPATRPRRGRLAPGGHTRCRPRW